MAKIQLLDQNTINKIAAGEVVERPAAVVKELIENAIDAGANAVTCEIKEGGISFIRITDNGSGIDKSEVDTAFLRHATSKIRTVEDLLLVSSLGFRGEALASIASVAQVELVTKTAKDMTGIRYVIEGGVKKTCEDIGCPNGTTFIIRNLFYNTPARRKFLKSATTEAGYINELMMRLAVSHPDVSFKFIVNNQIKLHTSGNNNLKDILYSIYGREIASSLVEVNVEVEDVKIHGFIGKPLISRGNRNYENFYINGRYIRSSIICKAIEEAYKPYIMQHKYPFTALHYEINSELIDVNVHPTKLEIRFRNGDLVFQLTQGAVAEALSTKEMIPEVSFDERKEKIERIYEAPEPFEQKRIQKEQSPFALKRRDQKNDFQNNDIRHEKNGNTLTAESIKETEIGTLTDVVNHAYEYGQQKAHHSELIQENTKSSVLAQEKENAFSSKNVNDTSQAMELVHESSQGSDLEKDSKDTLSIFEQLRLKREALKMNASESASNYDIVSEKDTVEQEIKSQIIEDENVLPEIPEISQVDVLKYDQGKQINLFEQSTSQEEAAPFLSAQARKNHRIIGQLFATYWIVEYDDKMFIIDQHAAHEKVLYEKTMKRVHDKLQMSQMIHPPIVLSLSMREEEIFVQHKESFERLGFEIEHFGGREYSIRAVPSDMLNIADETLLLDLIDQLVENHYERDSELVLEKVASMSCKAAIKGNQKISFQEASNLIDQLLELDNPYHCPHGRPVIISMSKYEIEKKFKRII